MYRPGVSLPPFQMTCGTAPYSDIVCSTGFDNNGMMAIRQSLPILVPPLPQQRWSCHNCGLCCRDLVAHLTRADRERIDAQGWAEILDRPPYVRLGDKFVLNHIPGRGCVFLQDDGKCAIHAKHGYEAKPLACQIFPFVLRPLGPNLRLSFRFDCPSLAESKGSPLAEHVPDLQRLIAQLPDLGAHSGDVLLTATRMAGDLEAHALVQAVDNWLVDSGQPLQQRLISLMDVLDTLGQANLDKVRGERFVELVKMLFGECSASPFATNLHKPTRRQRKLFRQLVFAHCEYARLSDATSGWRGKLARMWSQFRRSRVFAKPGGSVLIPELSGTALPLDQAEQVGPARADAEVVEELCVRYLRAQVLSASCYGPHYYGWDMLSGLSALVLRVAVWGLLARYAGLSRKHDDVHQEDAVAAIGLIGRTAGLGKALGTRAERMRLTYLKLDRGVQRLLQTFPLVS